MPWMWSWKQQLNKEKGAAAMERGHREEQEKSCSCSPGQSCGFVNQDLVQRFLVSALGLGLAAASPEVSWNISLAVEGSCPLMLLLVCGCDQTEEAGAAIQPCPTLSWTFQASSEPAFPSPWIQRAQFGWTRLPLTTTGLTGGLEQALSVICDFTGNGEKTPQ